VNRKLLLYPEHSDESLLDIFRYFGPPAARRRGARHSVRPSTRRRRPHGPAASCQPSFRGGITAARRRSSAIRAPSFHEKRPHGSDYSNGRRRTRSPISAPASIRRSRRSVCHKDAHAGITESELTTPEQSRGRCTAFAGGQWGPPVTQGGRQVRCESHRLNGEPTFTRGQAFTQ